MVSINTGTASFCRYAASVVLEVTYAEPGRREYSYKCNQISNC
jgi:hypothetical protein